MLLTKTILSRACYVLNEKCISCQTKLALYSWEFGITIAIYLLFSDDILKVYNFNVIKLLQVIMPLF